MMMANDSSEFLTLHDSFLVQEKDLELLKKCISETCTEKGLNLPPIGIEKY